MNSYRASSCFLCPVLFFQFRMTIQRQKTSVTIYSMVANTNASTMRPDIKILARLKSI